MPKILFAGEIALRGLNRCMPKQELNLLQFTTPVVTKFRTGTPQVVRSNVLQACSLAAGSNHVPDNILGDTMAPDLSQPSHCSKDLSLVHPSGSRPLIESGFYPVGNGHGPDVATFANQIDHGPVPLAHLNVVQLQAHQFRSPKTTTKQHGQHRVIALRAHSVTTSRAKYF